MASDPQINRSKETISTKAPEKSDFKRPEVVDKEVAKAGVGKEAYREAVGFDESVETTGKVSEILKEGQEQKGAGAGAKVTGAQKTYDPDKIRAQLLKNLPSEKAMKRQVEREIKKEIKYLHKKAMKMFNSPRSMSFFEMSNLMRKIRELKGLLVDLIKASLDTLKTLWLRFVHGIH